VSADGLRLRAHALNAGALAATAAGWAGLGAAVQPVGAGMPSSSDV